MTQTKHITEYKKNLKTYNSYITYNKPIVWVNWLMMMFQIACCTETIWTFT